MFGCSIFFFMSYGLVRRWCDAGLLKMSDKRLMVSDMNESLIRYDVTVTVARDGGHLPDPAAFAIGAQQAAASRGASAISAHTAEQIVSIVTVEAPSRPLAVAVALAVVSEALRCPAPSASR